MDDFDWYEVFRNVLITASCIGGLILFLMVVYPFITLWCGAWLPILVFGDALKESIRSIG